MLVTNSCFHLVRDASLRPLRVLNGLPSMWHWPRLVPFCPICRQVELLRGSLRLYHFRLYHQVEHIEGGSCAASGCRSLELLDPQYIAFAFAMSEALDIDDQRLPFAGSSDHQALVVIVPLALLQTPGVGRRRIRAGHRLGGDFEKDRGTRPEERFRSRFAGEVSRAERIVGFREVDDF